MTSQDGGGFKNSLEALLAKGNPMAGGRKKTTKQPEPIEEEKEKIKMDIFNDQDDDDKPAAAIDNVTYFLLTNS